MTVVDQQPLSCVLIANRGEIALRIIRTAKAMGMTTVIVHSDADADHPATSAADLAVRLKGSAPADTYLNVEAIIEAARRTGAEAIHPGYGFLSERADAARAIIDAGLVWIGPPPDAIAAMGSKIASKQLMRAAGVPVLPDAVVDGADVTDSDALTAAARSVGTPLLVKASAGGGGRGMRRVDDVNEVVDAVASAMREAQAAFGDGTVFLEQFVTEGRHVEIQILADRHGSVVSLHERDCSVQRRHQKIIEEAPSPVVDDDLRRRMGQAAVAAARAVGYEGAGTVEFLLDHSGRFAFLEMNTRLQVEHPVTEAVLGIDLVALQLSVAQGDRLPASLSGLHAQGHAIEARLYAEDPALNYRPSTGRLEAFSIPELPGVRVDAGVGPGTVVGPHYDPMLAKVIAHGPDRHTARRLLHQALSHSVIIGITTNRAQLLHILEHPEFADGDATTAFLDRHEILGAPVVGHHDPRSAWALAAVALADQAYTRQTASALTGLPSGWRNHASAPQERRYRSLPDGSDHTVRYRLDRSGAVAHLEVDGRELSDPTLLWCDPDRVRWQTGGTSSTWWVSRSESLRQVHGSGLAPLSLEALPRLPLPQASSLVGSLTAPMPGAVLRVPVAAGDRITAGQTVVVLEAMKMEHQVHSPHGGTVTEVLIAPGTQVDAGQILVVVEPDRDSEGGAP